MAKRIEMKPGDRYGRLVLIKEIEPYVSPKGEKKRRGLWLCDCGETTEVRLVYTRSGNTSSCGCYHRQISSDVNTRHGEHYTLEYSSWRSMRNRCNNPKSQDYRNYGGRGIEVCERWDTFENFSTDMGERPSTKYEIDRKDNNKGYFPENCHWVSKRINSKNTRIAKRWHIRGVTYFSLSDAAALLGISNATVIRWCDGATIKGVRYPPKPECYSYPAYVRNNVRKGAFQIESKGTRYG